MTIVIIVWDNNKDESRDYILPDKADIYVEANEVYSNILKFLYLLDPKVNHGFVDYCLTAQPLHIEDLAPKLALSVSRCSGCDYMTYEQKNALYFLSLNFIKKEKRLKVSTFSKKKGVFWGDGNELRHLLQALYDGAGYFKTNLSLDSLKILASVGVISLTPVSSFGSIHVDRMLPLPLEDFWEVIVKFCKERTNWRVRKFNLH